MVTSVDIDEDVLARARYYAPKISKKALIDLALKTFVKVHDQTRAKALRGKLVWDGEKYNDLR
jgi:Arc/MetJ family transcription regulator